MQSEPRSDKAHPLSKELFHNNSYARDDQGDNPGQEIDGSKVSCKKTVTVAGILISSVKVLAAPTWSEGNRCG